MAGLAVEMDGSFYLVSALAETHYTASAQATHFGAKAWWHPVVFPLHYLWTFGAIATKLAFSLRTYLGLLARFRKTLKLFRESATYRKKTLAMLSLAALIGGASFLAWRQYVMTQKVEQQAETLKNLKAHQATTQKELAKEKERMRFLWW